MAYIDKGSLKCRMRCQIGSRKKVKGAFSGITKVYHLYPDGREELISVSKNTIQAALLNAAAKAVGDGALTFYAINHMQFMASGPTSLAIEIVSKVAGGTGAENYITLQATYTNSSGSSKTVTDLKLGYDIGGGGERIDALQDITDHVVPDTHGLKVDWQITFTNAGELFGYYAYKLIQMLGTGTFAEPDEMAFVDSIAVPHSVSIAKSAGGTGAEAYVEFLGTYVATGVITIDYVELRSGSAFTSNDFDPDKALSNGESIAAYIEITHTAA